MVGRKTKNVTRTLIVKNLYLPEDVQQQVAAIAASVTTSSMELYVQAVKSYMAANFTEYLSWMASDWRNQGGEWSVYVDNLLSDNIVTPVTVPHFPSGLVTVAPITPSTPPTTINKMILPEITILLVKAAARREGMMVSKVVSQMVKWYLARYWEINYARLMRDPRKLEFILAFDPSTDKAS